MREAEGIIGIAENSLTGAWKAACTICGWEGPDYNGSDKEERATRDVHLHKAAAHDDVPAADMIACHSGTRATVVVTYEIDAPQTIDEMRSFLPTFFAQVSSSIVAAGATHRFRMLSCEVLPRDD